MKSQVPSCVNERKHVEYGIVVFRGPWQKAARRRRALIERYCYNPTDGCFYDYDYVSAPIYLWPFTPNALSTGGFTNGYGFKQN